MPHFGASLTDDTSSDICDRNRLMIQSPRDYFVNLTSPYGQL